MKTAAHCGMVVGALLSATAARAQASGAPGVAPVAERLFYEGLDALGRHDYERAREDFAASVALVPRGSAFRNLATVDWALGRHVEALEHLRAALRMPDLPAELRERAKADLDAAYAATGHLAVGTDPGATVTIDGIPADGPAPLAHPVDVEPGLRLVEAHLDDRVGRSHVDAKAGVVVRANVFVAPALLSSQGPGTPTPLAFPAPPAEGARPVDPAPRSSFWSARRTVGTLVGAAGIGALAVGLVYFGVTTGDENRAHAAESGLGASSCAAPSRAASCAAFEEATSAQSRDAQISRSLVGIGALGALAGDVLVLWPEGRTRPVAVTPAVDRAAAGLQVAGCF